LALNGASIKLMGTFAGESEFTRESIPLQYVVSLSLAFNSTILQHFNFAQRKGLALYRVRFTDKPIRLKSPSGDSGNRGRAREE
jgi:hypothetical protein